MRPACVLFLLLFLLPVIGFLPFSATGADYGDIIKKKKEYKEITEGRDDDDDDDDDRHDHHHYHSPSRYYYPAYPYASSNYRSSSRSGGSGLSGHLYVGITIGESEYDYDDIDSGDATVFHLGYRPEDSYLGFELSIYDSGDSEVTSLTDIEVEFETINLVATINSSRNYESTFNFFGQGGIYFADTTLSGPAASVSENSNGFLIAVGIELMVNRNFGLRAAAYHLNNVEDFANDESISVFSLGGQVVF